MEYLITSLIALVVIIFIYVKNKYNFWTNLGVHQFDVEIPYGNGRDLKNDHISIVLQKYYQRAKEIKAKFFGIYFFHHPSLVIVDLDLVKTIAIKDFHIFPNRGIYFNEKDDPLGAHMINIENESWRVLRHKLSPTFTSQKLKTMFSTIHEVTKELINVINEKMIEMDNCVEIKEILARFTTDVIGTTAFGIACNSLRDKNSKFYEMGTQNFARKRSFLMLHLLNNFPDIARKFHIRSVPKDISDFYLKITKETIEYREKNPDIKRNDFMSLLVEMKQNNIVTVNQIAAQSFAFYAAGFETSSSTMTFCMYEMSLNLAIQAKAREDVRKIIKKHCNEFTYDAISEMQYLEQCVDETLRKYPVIMHLTRKSLKKYEIPNSNVVIPKGQLVFIPTYAIHHDPELYPDPETFNPDRFLPEEKAKRHPQAYIPFGEGNRNCIGARFGKMEAMLGLAKVLMNFKFELDRIKTPVPLKFKPNSFFLSFEEDIFLNMENVA